MTPQELVARGGIYFEKIQNGMSEYDWESQYFSPRMADRFIRELWKKNGDEGSFCGLLLSISGTRVEGEDSVGSSAAAAGVSEESGGKGI